MGLRLGKIFKSIFKRVPGVVTAVATGGASLLTPGGAMAILKPGGFAGSIGAGVPSIQGFTGVPALFAQPVVQRNGGIAVPTAAGAVTPFAVVGMSRAVAMAITKLAVALGIPLTLAKLSSVGLRLWRTLNTFARRHPGISILTWLASLGLLADEAAEFMLWGQAKQRRRRGRGISARDIRTCRRTMRRMAAFQRDMFRGAPRRRALGRARDGVVAIQN